MNKKAVQFLSILGILWLIVFGAQNFTAQEHSDTLKFWVFDVGQGDALFFDTPTHQQVLIDGGPDSSVTRELSRVMGIKDKDIDLIVISHNHADHLSGINDVLRHYTVKKIWISGAIHTSDTYRTFLELVKEHNIPTEAVTTGSRADYGDLHGIALTPFSSVVGQMPDNQHDANVQTFWQYGDETLLLTGDGEVPQEQELIRRGLLRPTTILKVGHHGSYTSTSQALLDTIKPQIAVISVGKNNTYGHPHQSTLDKLSAMHIPTLRTDQSGTIEFDIFKDHYAYKTVK